MFSVILKNYQNWGVSFLDDFFQFFLFDIREGRIVYPKSLWKYQKSVKKMDNFNETSLLTMLCSWLIFFRNECSEFSFSLTHFHVYELQEKNTAMACHYCTGPLGFWCCMTLYINYSNITKGNRNWEKDWKVSHYIVKKPRFRENSILNFFLIPLRLSLTKARQLPSYMIVISTNVLWSPPLIERVRNWLHVESCQIKSFSITRFPITEWYNEPLEIIRVVSFD